MLLVVDGRTRREVVLEVATPTLRKASMPYLLLGHCIPQSFHPSMGFWKLSNFFLFNGWYEAVKSPDFVLIQTFELYYSVH